MARVAQLCGIVTGMMDADAKLMDTGLLELRHHLGRALLGKLGGHEVGRKRFGIERKAIGQGFEGRALFQPKGLIGAELSARRDWRQRWS